MEDTQSRWPVVVVGRLDYEYHGENERASGTMFLTSDLLEAFKDFLRKAELQERGLS